MTLDLILLIEYYILKSFITFDIASHIFVFRAVVGNQIMILPTSFNIYILKNVILENLCVRLPEELHAFCVFYGWFHDTVHGPANL